VESTIGGMANSMSTKTYRSNPTMRQGPDSLADELEATLMSRYGVLLSTRALIDALGFPSLKAYQQAIARRTIPIPLFKLENRRGRFGLARDVAVWLAAQRSGATACQSGAASVVDPTQDIAASAAHRGAAQAVKQPPSGCL